MKKAVLITIIFLATAVIANAQGKFGLGIIVGEPTGLSGRYKITESNSIDGAIGWSFAKYSSLHIHGDYLQNITKLGNEVPLYIGIGGRIKMKNNDNGDDTRIAVRVPVGIVYEPSSTPIDLFLEVVPMLDLTPKSEFTFNAAIGVRYFFK